MAWLLRRILALWVRFTVLPEDAALRLQNTPHAVCYVLEHHSVTDLAVLQNACVKLKLPRPRKKLLAAAKDLLAAAKDLRSCFYLSRPLGVWDERLDRRPPPALTQIVELLRAHPELDVDLVPVAVYWGRAPQREASWFRLMLVEDWALTSRLRKFFQVLFNGRNTLLEIDDAISLRRLLGEGVTSNARRVTRALRLRYRTLRAARIGPDLSHRRTIVAEILGTQAVRAAVAQEAREKKLTRHAALLEAQRLAEEIAANYSHAFVRFMEHLLTWLWNRLYSGVVFEHGATLDEVAEGHEIIYVPCHRSHMDYLLLSYVIYRHGHAIPHIAAGINLNLPIVGRLLRKGGAFFIRRSLRSSLYAIVFMNYLAAIMARGHAIEYFIEGGRSRTGRLLQPKTGMLSMTVRSFLRAPARPVAFVPVYFGYEHIVEGPTYIGELSGTPKQKESILGLLRTLPRLRKRFGKVHVNIGEPVLLGELLDACDPEWRAHVGQEEGKLPWINTAVDELAAIIMRNINSAAAVTPINLLAVALLASPRHTLVEPDLLRQLQLYLALLADRPYGARVTVTQLSSEAIVAYGEAMQVVSRRKHPLGDLVQMSDAAAALAAYYRNNVLHLFAVPSLVACAFLANSVMRREDIHRLAARIYPYIASELFLRWREAEIGAVVDDVLGSFERHGLLNSAAGGGEWRRPAPTSAEAMQLSLLAQATLQTIERYYLTISLLLKAGSGEITQSTLEKRCQLMAERMSLVYGFDSPEFFDRSLFENFIDLLRNRGVVRTGAAGTLEFDEVLMRVAADAQLVLNEEIRHSILQVTHA
ncbi:MAG TPA: glycerol-3-phosphate 1-O-acyltransferase PlsB [Steroidobacteraceae bacterium]|nr:glycerol-3-phosphate 1-O-acyltransferase PlsB [Steroidobacteraceae bacterium]